jgi:Leucine-rich repeat (LRR) protein
MNNQATRIVAFPTEYSIGELFLLSPNHRGIRIEFGEARGNIVVPAGKELCLQVPYPADFDPQIFTTLTPDSLAVFCWFCTSQVTNAAVAPIRHLSGLKGLALWETGIGDETLWNLRHLLNLRWLDIGNTQVTDAGLSCLKEMEVLKELSLTDNRITDLGLWHLQKLPALNHLDLMNTAVTDEGIEILRKMTGLNYLRIYGTKISDSGYQALKRALPNCEIWFYKSNDL